MPARPHVWLLADGQPGNDTQIAGLAARFRDAGAVATVKAARANRLQMLGAVLLGGRGWSLDRRRSDALTPPWPDLVVGTGRRSAAWVRYVKRSSAGRTLAVQFGQKGGNLLNGLDAAVALDHWRFPEDPRRLTAPLPPTGATADRLAEAKAAAGDVLPVDKGPWLLLAVGGRAFDHDLPPEDIGRLAATAAGEAARLGGSLAAVTSRRTGDAGEAAIRAAAPRARVFSWRDRDAPFLGLLASADAAVVTGDSESMIAEAVAAGRPTYVAPVRRRLNPRMALERAVDRFGRLGGPCAWLAARLWAAGVLLPPRDLAAMSAGLAADGYVRPFAAGAVSLDWRPPPPPDAALAERLLALIPPR